MVISYKILIEGHLLLCTNSGYYCLTSKENESLSNVILEEMALGKPVIATDVGGNRELIIDGNTGYIIDARNRKALIDRIMQLYHDSSLRNSMGLAVRRRVQKFY